MQVKDCMKRNVCTTRPSASIREAAAVLVQRHIGSLPVVDEGGRLVGLLQLRNLLELVLPDFVNLLDEFDFVPDFGAVESRLPSAEALGQPVSAIMGEPVCVVETSGLLRAYSVLRKHQLHDLPVVDANGVVVGIASRVDLATAYIARWDILSGGGK